MRDKTQKKFDQQKKSRLEILKSWMTSFVMTTTIVIVAVVFIPKSPKATILNTKVFSDAITYQVMITDEDMALNLETLNITLENQFETYTYPLSLGLNVGVFDQLRPNTLYRMHIFGSKGFGLERLDSITLETKEERGGAIIGYHQFDSTPHSLSYLIDIFISDFENRFEDIRLYYLFSYEGEEINPDDFDYIEINNYRSTIELYDIPIYNTKVYLYLEVSDQGIPVVLDELTFNVPYYLESSIYIDLISQSNIHIILYPDMNPNINAIYTIDLYLGHQKVKTKQIKPDDSSDSYMYEVIFDSLRRETEYLVVVSVNYQDPITLIKETKRIHEEVIQTLGQYDVTFQFTEFDSHFEVYIHVIDSNHYFQIPYFVIYQQSDHHPIYLDGNDYTFTQDQTGKFVSFTIDRPTEYPYQLVIGIRNQSNYTIRHIIYDKIIEKP